MAIEINGTTGISGVDGTAGSPALQGADTNTGISFGTDEVAINTGGTERVKVDSSGKFGIGQTSPNALLEVNSNTDGQEVARFEGNYAASGDVTLANFRRDGGAVAAAVQYHDSLTAMSIGSTTNHAFAFRTNDTERMRITAGGKIYINSTTAPVVGTEHFGVNAGSASDAVGLAAKCDNRLGIPLFLSNTSDTTNTYLAKFATGSSGSTRGEIYYNGSQLVYATSSDYRLKENVVGFNDGIGTVKQLRPVRYNWIESGNEDIGFIAHEVQAVFPNAVGGEKDAINEDGQILPQTYDPSKLVPLLTAALQEAIAKIETLETKVAALEGGAV